MIPKILHFVWIGDESRRPDIAIDSWRQLNPDYEIRVWGNESLQNTTWINAKHIRQMISHEICGAADLMRYEILYEHGGICLDADSVCLAPLEEWLLKPDAFCSWEQETMRPGLIGLVALGSVPNHSFFKACIDGLYEISNLCYDSAWKTTGPLYITRKFRESRYDITIYPSHYFIKKHFTGIEYKGNGHCFANQLWNSTSKQPVSKNRIIEFEKKLNKSLQEKFLINLIQALKLYIKKNSL